MAYGFRCAKCGYQETEHEIGVFDGYDGDSPRGYRYSFKDCPGFVYSKKDETDVVNSYLGDVVGDRFTGPRDSDFVPERFRQRVKKLEKKYWRDLGYPDGPPRMFNDEILMILPDGRIVDIGS